ncbi:hypothetical protein [Collinsella ihumii]|uniref:DUF4064 domain-containing protein n=1 Tax=Collinsella ihumii TaxID=1720204 RepID=A0AAW7JSE5_9ACTN|nr:hypothetical protein [Collinsella ihumii]MDN0070294.1 hypothetical protein [Collinsella ihumii]
MSSLCKTVKIISLIMLAMGVVGIVYGVYQWMTAPVIEGFEQGQVYVRASAVLVVVCSILFLVGGVSGALGANNPGKLKPYTVLCAILAIANGIAAALFLVAGAFMPVFFVFAILALVGAVFAVRARKDASNRLL